MHTQTTRTPGAFAPQPRLRARKTAKNLLFAVRTQEQPHRLPQVSELFPQSGVNTVMLISASQSAADSLWPQPCNDSANYFRTLSSL